jgi:hypothetical protein
MSDNNLNDWEAPRKPNQSEPDEHGPHGGITLRCTDPQIADPEGFRVFNSVLLLRSDAPMPLAERQELVDKLRNWTGSVKPEKISKRRRLKRPEQVVAAVQDTVARLAAGTLDPKQAKATLYGLQTLLVAMRLAEDLKAGDTAPKPEPRKLKAGHQPLTIQAMAAEPPEDYEE